jgi:hypothetical protein
LRKTASFSMPGFGWFRFCGGDFRAGMARAALSYD